MDTEIGRFLRARRARLTPQAVGLADGTEGVDGSPRRRVPGLRREELARLAGVSTDYYVRLEQGRAARVSDDVLAAIARVLGLTALERQHLARLARGSGAGPAAGRCVVHPTVQHLLDAMPALPAYVLGRRTDIIAWNAAATVLFGFDHAGTPLNLARRLFDPAVRSRYPRWTEVVEPVVTRLRLEVGEFPDDRELAALVEEFVSTDEHFRRLWHDQFIAQKPHGTLLLRHPAAGDLSFVYQLLAFPQSPGQKAVVLLPADDATAVRVRSLVAGATGT